MMKVKERQRALKLKLTIVQLLEKTNDGYLYWPERAYENVNEEDGCESTEASLRDTFKHNVHTDLPQDYPTRLTFCIK